MSSPSVDLLDESVLASPLKRSTECVLRPRITDTQVLSDWLTAGD